MVLDRTVNLTRQIPWTFCTYNLGVSRIIFATCGGVEHFSHHLLNHRFTHYSSHHYYYHGYYNYYIITRYDRTYLQRWRRVCVRDNDQLTHPTRAFVRKSQPLQPWNSSTAHFVRISSFNLRFNRHRHIRVCNY